MTDLTALWIPIVVAAALVFVASSIIHMVLPWHKSDYPVMPNEDAALDALGKLAIPPGDYFIPRPKNAQDMNSPEFVAKLNKGPVVVMTVMRGGSSPMGKSLLYWFVYCFVVGLFAAYIASRSLPPASSYGRVFQLVGTTTFIGYSLALWQMTIWYRRSPITTLKATVDGLFYALLTAGVFGWLWPH